MYGDSHALSSDSRSIFLSDFKQKEEAASLNRELQLPSMESEGNTNYSYDFGHQNGSCNNSSKNNSGLLRFRSAPTSLLTNFTTGGEKIGELGSRFCSDEVNRIHVASESEDNKGSVNRFMNSHLPLQYPRQSGAQLSYRVGLDQGKIGSSLVRQNSSPAGLFSHLTSQNGYAGGRGIGSYRMADVGGNGELSPSSSWFRNDLMHSSLGMLSRINEADHQNTGPNGPDEGKVRNSSGGDSLLFTSGFPFGSWNDSWYFADNSTSGIKKELDCDPNLFVNAEKCEARNRPCNLSHHLSLPKASAEVAAMATVPCKVRAKRGCATHPRSIAERVRRTKISKRMRKLQELVPNMDKQTNTADMLDFAVDYIKSLQQQYKTLCDIRANCRCDAFQKVALDQTHR